ncbi:MAG: substrate-binding domain-containing protein [Planctomycetota bacterium]|nr:substrate-binding domain-containing protein [Planctomycetota bacterium]
MNAKYAEVAQAIGRRIRAGDYAGARIPGERVLATQFGVSHMTARKAVDKLLQEGVLHRLPNGRLTVRRNRKAPARHLAFLEPAYYSPVYERMRAELERAAARHGATVRPVDFVHWDDPAIPEALQGFDGVFLAPSGIPMPERVCRLFANPKARPAVSLEVDLSAWGIPSLCFFPPSAVNRLLDHLWNLGHRAIDCLNTQPDNEVIRARIGAWRAWTERRGAGGRLIDAPVKPYELAIEQAYRVMLRELKNPAGLSPALVVTAGATGLAVLRALHDRGLRPGVDLSVAAVNGEDLARYSVPTLTSLEPPAMAPFLERALAWVFSDPRAWEGPLLVEAGGVELFEGKSAGPPARG